MILGFSLVFLAVSASFQDLSPEESQDSSPAYIERSSTPVLLNSPTGDWRVAAITQTDIPHPLPYREILDDVSLEELEVSSTQRKELTEAISVGDRLLSQFRQRLAIANTEVEVANAKDWFNNESNSIRGKVESVLLGTQIDRLVQVQNRRYASRFGLCALLRRLDSQGSISLSERELEEIKAKISEELPKLVAQTRDKCRAEAAEITDVISKESHSIDSSDIVPECDFAIDVLIAQLEIQKPSGISETGVFRRKDLSSAMFIPSESGECRLYTPEPNRTSSAIELAEGIEFLLADLTQPSFADLRLSSEQMAKVIELRLFVAEKLLWAEQYLESSENLVLANETVLDNQLYIKSKVEKDLNEILSQAQIKKLTRFLKDRQSSSYGIVTQLYHGDVLTPAAKRLLERQASQSRQELVVYLKGLIKKLNQDLAKCLTPENRASLGKALGVEHDCGATLFTVGWFQK